VVARRANAGDTFDPSDHDQVIKIQVIKNGDQMIKDGPVDSQGAT
jgi:hypothetical protein